LRSICKNAARRREIAATETRQGLSAHVEAGQTRFEARQKSWTQKPRARATKRALKREARSAARRRSPVSRSRSEKHCADAQEKAATSWELRRPILKTLRRCYT